MARIENGIIILTKEETELLKGTKEAELIPNKKGIFLLIDKNLDNNNEQNESSIEQSEDSAPFGPSGTGLEKEKEKIITEIKKGNFKELVEGKFEEKLNEKETLALNELKADGIVILFKLNENYKKGVYKLGEIKQVKGERIIRESEKFGVEKKILPDYTLEKDGFLATTNSERAKIISQEYKEQIEGGEYTGIRSFDGNYYLIETILLQEYLSKALAKFYEKNTIALVDLARELNASVELIKIIIEFLKEEGEILEKAKEIYTFIN